MDKNFGNRLKNLRGTLPQKEFAAVLGIQTNTLGRWERNEQSPTHHDILNILEKFRDISPNWLLTGEGPMKKIAEPIPVSRQEPAIEAPAENDLGFGASVELLAKIYNSGNAVLIRAIAANLHSFGEAVDNKALAQKAIAMMDEMNKRILALENDLAKLKRENEALKNNSPPSTNKQAA